MPGRESKNCEIALKIVQNLSAHAKTGSRLLEQGALDQALESARSNESKVSPHSYVGARNFPSQSYFAQYMLQSSKLLTRYLLFTDQLVCITIPCSDDVTRFVPSTDD